MRTSLATLDIQIAKLQRKADAIKAREKGGVIARIREAIEHYGLSAQELGFGRGSRGNGAAIKKSRKPHTQRKGTGVVKFRDGQGNTWTGHGRQPGWFKAALATGKKPEDLAVKP